MISEKVKALASLEKKRGYEMAELLGIAQPNYARKLTTDTWSAKDIATIAKALGWRLAFIKGDERIYIDD